MSELRRYCRLLLPQIVLAVLVILFAYYAIGVVERNNVLQQAEVRFDQMEAALGDNEAEQDTLVTELRDHYLTRARAAAMMISGSPDMLETETGLEELRIALGCSVVSVSDAMGEIIYSTAHTNTGQHISDALSEGLTNKGFSDVVIEQNGTDYTILAGTTRLDAEGVIQLSFPESELEQLVSLDDTAVVLNQPFCESGTMAILDSDLQYISHTNSALIGATATFTGNQLEEAEDQFTVRIGGDKHRIMYRRSGEHILMCTLPNDTLYQRRNTVVMWLIFLSAVLFVYNILRLHSEANAPKHSDTHCAE